METSQPEFGKNTKEPSAEDLVLQKLQYITKENDKLRKHNEALLVENNELKTRSEELAEEAEELRQGNGNSGKDRQNLDRAREQNYELEELVDDYKRNVLDLTKQIEHTKIGKKQAETSLMRLKVELDIANEKLALVPELEKQVRKLQKRVEDSGNLSNRIKIVEKNQMTTKFENVSRRAESYREKLGEVNQELEEVKLQLSRESQKALAASAECHSIREELTEKLLQIEVLLNEKSELNDIINELRESFNDLSKDKRQSIDIELAVEPIEMELEASSFPTSPTPLQEEMRKQIELMRSHLKYDKPQAVNETTIILEHEKPTSVDYMISDEGARILVQELRKREKELCEQLLEQKEKIAEMKLKLECSRETGNYSVVDKSAENLDWDLIAASNDYKSKQIDELEKSVAVLEVEKRFLQSRWHEGALARVSENQHKMYSSMLTTHRAIRRAARKFESET